MKLRALLTIVALASVLCPSIPWAQVGDGEMTSNNFWVRMYTINSAGRSFMQNPNFQGRACLGEVCDGVHSAIGFQLVSGFCAQAHWYLTRTPLLDLNLPDLVIDTGLGPPYPNPTIGPVRLSFAIRAGETGTMRVYDLTGRLVRDILGPIEGPSSQSIVWDLKDGHGRAVPAGVYFARLETKTKTLTRQMVLLGR